MRVRLANLVRGALIVGALATVAWGTASAGGNTNGIGGSMPAYYDHQLFTINFFQLTTAQATLLAKNSQQNTIYQSDPGLPGGAPFVSVIDAIPADGMNPLWVEVQIAFTAGHTPRQLFSDDEIAAAVASGEITLTNTNEMYRCSVISFKHSLGSSSAVTTSFGPVSGAGHAAVSRARTTTWGAIKSLYR